MNAMYQDCPNLDCQGLIPPTAVAVTRWRREPRGRNASGMRRIHYIYCETCGRAYEIHELGNGFMSKFHEFTVPDLVTKIRRRIASLNGTEVGSEVDCYA